MMVAFSFKGWPMIDGEWPGIRRVANDYKDGWVWLIFRFVRFYFLWSIKVRM